jgi:copper chaperone CopZ
VRSDRKVGCARSTECDGSHQPIEPRDAVVAHVAAVPGVESVTVDLGSGVVSVRAARPVDGADVAAAVADAGFAVAP